MTRYRQIPRESEMLRLLAQGRVDTSPLKLVAVEREPKATDQPKSSKVDATIRLGWGKKVYRFVVECKAVSTPKQVAAAVELVKRSSTPPQSLPMIFVPYLPPAQLRILEERQVSGVDLSGNALIVVPDEMLVFRTGAPNRFRRPGMIKNVYRKNSSIVPRAFLLKARYSSVTEVMDEIQSRGGDVSQATVSKVCASLDQDLLIERTKGQVPRTRSLRLIQPDKLLDLLVENYTPPAIIQRLTAKTPLTPDQFRRRVMQWRSDAAEKAALTGASSAERYAVIAREPIQSLYCSNLDSLLASVGPDLEETSRFANIELLETDEDFAYFDTRDDLAASPVQTYLELMQGDKREQQTAEQLRKAILRPLGTKG